MADELPPPGSAPVTAARAGVRPPSPAELESAARLRTGAPARARLAASVIVVRDGGGGGGRGRGRSEGDGWGGGRGRGLGAGGDGVGGRGAVEVLLVRRNPAARFMGGVWVFPGGAVDAADGEGDRAHRAAGVRELAEEAGIDGVDPAGLVKFSRWITPAELAIRFDTHFFLAPMPAGQEARVDGEECVAHAWFTPQAALDAHADGRILLVFPTIRQLEQIRGFATVGALIDHARGRQVTTVRGYEGPGRR